MSDRSERHSRRLDTSRGDMTSDWLRTLAAVAGMLGLYFVAPFGQDDDPLPLAFAAGYFILGLVGSRSAGRTSHSARAMPYQAQAKRAAKDR